jgi:hypothetical protein
VTNGTPANADVEGETSVRNAVMESFTQNNPSQCLSADDAEGLHTLYPDCDGVFYSTAPNCIKVNLNFGAVRMFLYLGVPLLVVVWVMLVFDYVSPSPASRFAPHTGCTLTFLLLHTADMFIPTFAFSPAPFAVVFSLWTTTSAFRVSSR